MIRPKPEKSLFFSLMFALSLFLSCACAWMESIVLSPTPTLSISIENSPTSVQPAPIIPSSIPVEPTIENLISTEAIPATQPSSDSKPVLYLGIMVHLEGWHDHKDQVSFERHAALIREYATLFEKYGAKLTLESKEVTGGAQRWGDNVLLEMEQRGHGIGVHADEGGSRDYDCSHFADKLRKKKEELEALGVSVRHVSGNTSHCDWVTATVDAGYLFTTGQVAYSVMSLPEAQRPPQYHDCRGPAACHQTFPPDLADRIHPWRAADGSNWLHNDPNGKLVILASSQVLPCMHEELTGQSTQDCAFDNQDINDFFQQLERAISLSESDQVNMYYTAWSLGKALDKAMLEDWLKRIQTYIQAGQVEWKTLPQMYDAYVQWEQRR